MTATLASKKSLPLGTGALLALGLTGCIVVGPTAENPPTAGPVADAPTTNPPPPPVTTEPPLQAPPSSEAPVSPTPDPTTATPATATPAPTPADWPETIAQVQSGVVQFSVTTCESSGTGSGFLIAPDLVVTAAHVVANASAVRVSTPAGNASASVLGINELADLALVQTSRPLEGHQFGFQPADPPLGTEVAALGYPLGQPLGFTKGTVSGLNRTIDLGFGPIQNIMQTDTALNPGNSGGPLLTQDGRVAGVVSAGERGAEGIAFAVSGFRAESAASEWQERGIPSNPSIAATHQPPTHSPFR